MDINLMGIQLQGLETKGKNLVAQKDLFLKAQGLREQVAEERTKIAGIEKAIAELKEKLTAEKAKKKNSVSETIGAITEKMNAILPDGEAVLDIDGGVSIGWKIGDLVKPYNGLSGGESVVFNGALAHALDSGMIIFEAAECDQERLIDLMANVHGIQKQIIINTWFGPSTEIPEDDWNVVKL